jgi:coenzyme F420-reducing hydrogenase beta subunit
VDVKNPPLFITICVPVDDKLYTKLTDILLRKHRVEPKKVRYFRNRNMRLLIYLLRNITICVPVDDTNRYKWWKDR